jgi:hypothetical protein
MINTFLLKDRFQGLVFNKITKEICSKNQLKINNVYVIIKVYQLYLSARTTTKDCPPLKRHPLR